MAEIRWAFRARRDLRAIRDHIAQASPVYARRMATRLVDRTDLLVEHPAAGRRVPEYGRPDIRERVALPYRVIYRYVEGSGAMDVLTIIHGRQQLPERV